MWFWHILWASYDFLKPSYLFFFLTPPAQPHQKTQIIKNAFDVDFESSFELHLIFWSFLNIFAGIVFFEKMGQENAKDKMI